MSEEHHARERSFHSSRRRSQKVLLLSNPSVPCQMNCKQMYLDVFYIQVHSCGSHLIWNRGSTWKANSCTKMQQVKQDNQHKQQCEMSSDSIRRHNSSKFQALFKKTTKLWLRNIRHLQQFNGKIHHRKDKTALSKFRLCLQEFILS